MKTSFYKIKTFLAASVMMLITQSTWATISSVVASNDATNATYRFTYTGTPGFLRLFLDADRNSLTGARRLNIGADYLIENGNFYRYSGVNGAWGWTRVKAATMTKSSSTSGQSVQWTISRADLGSPSSLLVVGQIESPLESTAILTHTLSAPVTTTTVPPSTVTWTRCATENGTCTFTGTRQVRYGTNGIYAYKTATGSIACNNATFGDSVVGAQKDCDYSSQLLTTTTTIPVVTTTMPVVTTTTLAPSSPTGSMSQVSFSASSAQFPNPERGFYRQFDCIGTSISTSTIASWRSTDQISVILCNGYLTAFKTTLISQATLDRIEANFNTIRAAGAKVVLRFAYTQNATLGDDATPAMVNAHLDQLTPILRRHSDVIATMQAGLIGAWGEWDSSANFGFYYNRTAQNWADRKALVEKLLTILPANRTVSLHMVYDKQRLFNITTPLTASEAYLNTPKARIGFHNDCFLSTATDMGTYTNYSTEYPFQSEDTKYLPQGGETCKLNAPRTDCPTALKELAGLHWSYLHLNYNVDVLNSWRSQGCFDTVKAKLGYRFVLQNAAFSTSAKVGGQINVGFNIVNQGFGAPFNPRTLELILRNTSTGAVYRIKMNADPRRWLPGTTINVSQTLTLPASLPPGNYALLLNLPDPEAALYGKPAYSIQLANSNVWESSTGFNNLNFVLPVSQ